MNDLVERGLDVESVALGEAPALLAYVKLGKFFNIFGFFLYISNRIAVEMKGGKHVRYCTCSIMHIYQVLSTSVLLFFYLYL